MVKTIISQTKKVKEVKTNTSGKVKVSGIMYDGLLFPQIGVVELEKDQYQEDDIVTVKGIQNRSLEMMIGELNFN